MCLGFFLKLLKEEFDALAFYWIYLDSRDTVGIYSYVQYNKGVKFRKY